MWCASPFSCSATACPFWKVITLVGDFLIEPLWIALRAFSAAVALSAVAAITGRPVRFPTAMRECVAWQGVWVLGLAVRVALMLAMHRSEVDTSIVLLLPPRMYAAREWVVLQQIDCFALIGWLGMAWGACRRGQASLCGVVADVPDCGRRGGSDHCRHIPAGQSGHTAGVVSRVGWPGLKLGQCGEVQPAGNAPHHEVLRWCRGGSVVWREGDGIHATSHPVCCAAGGRGNHRGGH